LFARLIIALLMSLVVIPLQASWLAGKSAGRCRRESTWPITRGTFENVRVTRPEDAHVAAPIYARALQTVGVEATFSYSHAGEYYSGFEKRTFLVRSAASRFISLPTSASPGKDLVELSLSRHKLIMRVAVNPDHPDRAFIVGFFGDAETFARNIEGAVPVESSEASPTLVQ